MDIPFPPRRIADIPPEPWKNGGGVTRTLARHGDAWRVSLADIDRDGAYSSFPGTTRLSMIVRGAGVTLRDAATVIALAPRVPLLYDGGPGWDARLVDGPCQALNVMAPAGAYRLSASLIDGQAEIPARADAVVLAGDAEVRLHDGAARPPVELKAGEYAVLAAGHGPRQVVLARPGGHASFPPVLVVLQPLDAQGRETNIV